MSLTPAQRKAKQRKYMIEKGFVRKDFWLSESSLKIINDYKDLHNLSNDDAINKLLEKLA